MNTNAYSLFCSVNTELYCLKKKKKKACIGLSCNRLVENTVLNAIYNYERNKNRAVIVENIAQILQI